ncbi:MAG: hypothetical protein V4608_16905 [Bacteroidota bacterium]
MKQNNKIATIFQNFLLLALSGIIIGQLYNTFIKYEGKFENPVQTIKQDYGNDFITQYGKRYEEIKKTFPSNNHFSYVGEANENFAPGYFNYVLTQYYLSPNLIFINDTIHDTIIYNLYNSKQIEHSTNLHLNNGWHVIKNYNNGLIVLAK